MVRFVRKIPLLHFEMEGVFFCQINANNWCRKLYVCHCTLPIEKIITINNARALFIVIILSIGGVIVILLDKYHNYFE